MTEITNVLPAIALRGTVILPGMIVHFDINRERSIKAVENAMLHDQKIFLTAQVDPSIENPKKDDVFTMGTVAYVKQVVKLPDNLIRVLVEGIGRAECLTFSQEEPYIKAQIHEIEAENPEDLPESLTESMKRGLKELFKQYSVQGDKVGKDLSKQILALDRLDTLIENISVNVPMPYRKRQQILDAVTLQEQYEILATLLNNEINVSMITKDLQKKIKARVDKNQRDYILREQLKLIREELGEDGSDDEIENFLNKLDELNASEEVKQKIRKEIHRLKTLGNNSAEANVSRGYIETLLSLPWDEKSEDSDDLQRAWKILEEGHYGLKDVKERIMEFLSVRKLTGGGKSPILCLAGPPGTGKTSIAKSMAEAMNKKYVRICLGGVRDEAEIRGHRRTYIGAMPGRITEALQSVGVSNPLMLLDEIDKTGSDYKGDVSSAMLEILDPEQNAHFRDHYVDIPQDLSDTLFIATANDVQSIPRPLLDRMELIEISGYTENEKIHIAKEHLIPKQLEVHGLKKSQLSIAPAALRKMINSYTKEAGVRSLERQIEKICRKAARLIMEDGAGKVSVSQKNLSDFLGRERYNYLMANKQPEIGIARGLAWTQVGGDTLQIEVNIMPGQGELQLTGQLGDVMKESAQAAITYVRSIAEQYGIGAEYFREHDLHMHIPEGAVPKDGPSAGITMATAILSAVAEKPVRSDLAMTGEITLRGRVLAIGGLKEKLLAAKYAGIKEVLVPKENEPVIEELDPEIKEGLKITFVSSMKEVLQHALVK